MSTLTLGYSLLNSGTIDLTTSVSGTFSIRMRTLPETSFPTAPVPVAVVCAGPPLPAHALINIVTTASSTRTGGEGRNDRLRLRST